MADGGVYDGGVYDVGVYDSRVLSVIEHKSWVALSWH